MAIKSRYAFPIIKILKELQPGEKLRLDRIIKIAVLIDGWNIKEKEHQFGLSDYLYRKYKNKSTVIMKMVCDTSNISENYSRLKDREGFYWIKK